MVINKTTLKQEQNVCDIPFAVGDENMAGGRPKKQPKYDYALVEDLAGIFCNQEEIAAILDISIRKAQQDEEFMRYFKKGTENAKQSIKRAQFKSAVNGNTTMLIWLGKQYLGQREPSIDLTIPEAEIEEEMNEYEK